MKRIPILSLALVLGLGFAVPAHAVELTAGVAGKGGIGWLDDGDFAEGQAPEVGFGGGAHIFGMIKLNPAFALGLDFDFLYTTHGIENAPDVSFDVLAPSVGIKGRLIFASGIATSLFANYVFASSTTSGLEGFGDVEASLSGFALGVDAVYRYQFKPYRTFLEVGIYVHYNYLVTTEVNGTSVEDDEASNYINTGVQLGVTFDVGL